MAELSVAKSPSNLNISYQQSHLLQQLFTFWKNPADVFEYHLQFILPNRKNLVDGSNIRIDFAHA